MLSVKEKLEEKEGYLPPSARLMFEGKWMENDRTMTDYGITAGKTLRVVVRVNGGDTPPAPWGDY